LIRSREVMLVVTVGATKRSNGGYCISPPAGPARALLIIGPSWWHVSQRDARQSSDVDANLHCCGAGEHINCRSFVVPLIRSKIYILKKQLEFFSLRKDIFGLCCIKLSRMLCSNQCHRTKRRRG